MASMYQMAEDAISNAIIALNKSFYSTPIEAAKAYNVTPRTVQQRLYKAHEYHPTARSIPSKNKLYKTISSG